MLKCFCHADHNDRDDDDDDAGVVGNGPVRVALPTTSAIMYKYVGHLCIQWACNLPKQQQQNEHEKSKCFVVANAQLENTPQATPLQ